MRFLTSYDYHQWCRTNGRLPPSDQPGCLSEDIVCGPGFITLEYPSDSGRKIALARTVLDAIKGCGDILLYVAEWDTWPSSQHPPIFARFREALGERQELSATPGHLITSLELDDGVSVLASALLFTWNCEVRASNSSPVFFASHDEFCGWWAASDEQILWVNETFAPWLDNESKAYVRHLYHADPAEGEHRG